MDRQFLYTLLLLFTGYFLGIIFSQKTLFAIHWLGKRIKALKISDFLLSWNDWVLVAIALLSIGGTFLYFWPREQILQKSDTVQLSIFLATFFTLFYSVVLKDQASKYRNRGIIELEFDSQNSDLYHLTNMDIRDNSLNIIASIPTYYSRLKVRNSGKETLENVEVVIEKVRSNRTLPRPFLSLNLHWAFAGMSNPRVVRIPQGMSRIIDMFEIMQPNRTAVFATQLNQANNPDHVRYQTLSTGFRSCTTTPNTLSDIYPFGSYEFFLSISADNTKPIFAKISIDYNGGWSMNINIMRSRRLKIALIKQGGNRRLVFD